jgi:hypothetical protein
MNYAFKLIIYGSNRNWGIKHKAVLKRAKIGFTISSSSGAFPQQDNFYALGGTCQDNTHTSERAGTEEEASEN